MVIGLFGGAFLCADTVTFLLKTVVLFEKMW